MLNRLFTQVVEFVSLGGPVVMILLALSVFALALIAVKILQFARERVARPAAALHAKDLWFAGRKAEAVDHVRGRTGLISRTAYVTLDALIRRSADRADIEDKITTLAKSRLHSLQGGLKALDAIAQMAPLLGLFGTVLGMIEAFRNLQSAGNSVDPSLLAGGIWVALLTTAVGLAVAMPVSLAVTWFESRIENERVSVETLVGELLNGSVAGDNGIRDTGDSAGLVHAH